MLERNPACVRRRRRLVRRAAAGQKGAHLDPGRMRAGHLDYAMRRSSSDASFGPRDGLEAGAPAHPLLHRRAGGPDRASPYRRAPLSIRRGARPYRPHGDASVYGDGPPRAGLLLRSPLIDARRRYGSVDGDHCAPTAYTEAKLSKTRDGAPLGLSEGTASTGTRTSTTRSRSRRSPCASQTYLASSTLGGIAIGMASNLAPHNLGRIIDATVHLSSATGLRRRRPDAALRPGPDFGRAAHRCGGIGAARTDRGSIIMRAHGSGRRRARGQRSRSSSRGSVPGEQDEDARACELMREEDRGHQRGSPAEIRIATECVSSSS